MRPLALPSPSTILLALVIASQAVTLAGCNLLARAVPCHVDDNCAFDERCRDGACVLSEPVPEREGGAPRADGGEVVVVEDAGALKDGGDPLPACAPRVVVTAGTSAVPAGHPLKLTLDHAALVTLGYEPDGSDLRLFHDDGSGVETSIPRVKDPLSSWSAALTELWFPLTAPLDALESTSAYVVRSREAAPLDEDERTVFPLADFFEREGGGVLEAPFTAPYGGVSVLAGGLELDTGNEYNRPFLDVALPPLTTRFELVLGFHFARTGPEGEYRVHLHLGDEAAMVEPLATIDHFARDGAAVSLVWSGVSEALPAEETLAADVVGGYTPLGVVSGDRRLVLRADPATDRYDVVVDGEELGSTLPFLTATDVISRFRLVLWRVATNIGARRLEYVFLKPLVADEPTVRVELPPECQ